MAELRRRGAFGVVHVVAEEEELLALAGEFALEFAERSRASSERVSIAGRCARFESRVIRGSDRITNAWRAVLPWVRMPISREYANLIWLRDRLFQVPQPIAAGVVTRPGSPRIQFLVCEEIADAVTLEEFLTTGSRTLEQVGPGARGAFAEASALERRRVLTELARELARMHALRFVHGQLSSQYVLVAPSALASRVFFTAPRAGGPSWSARCAADDLAQLLSCPVDAFSDDDTDFILSIYLEERTAQGRSVDSQRFRAEVERARASTADVVGARATRPRSLPER